MLDWIQLKDVSQLNEIDTLSFTEEGGIAIFKHSTRCSISSMAKNRLDKGVSEIPIYYLDLIQYRSISNEIASRYSIDHESPQLLIIKNGKVSEHSSHNMVSPNQLSR
ncbi:MAG: bacillithiol system redox-active protein YtxJ [Bacteroidia bacterium]